jgi:BlaI family penicillinase repressor
MFSFKKKYLLIYEVFVDLRKLRRMEKLTHTEEEAMLAVWRTGEGNVKSFMENMDNPAPYTTVASIIKNLERKGYLGSRLVGNAYLYKPIITEEEYKKKFLNNLVREYFDNSYKEMVNFFVEQKKLSARELREIITLIEKGNNNK